MTRHSDSTTVDLRAHGSVSVTVVLWLLAMEARGFRVRVAPDDPAMLALGPTCRLSAADLAYAKSRKPELLATCRYFAEALARPA